MGYRVYWDLGYRWGTVCTGSWDKGGVPCVLGPGVKWGTVCTGSWGKGGVPCVLGPGVRREGGGADATGYDGRYTRTVQISKKKDTPPNPGPVP